jgi:hypothetical protein
MTPRQNPSGGKERLDAPGSAATITPAACSSPKRLLCCAMHGIDRLATAGGSVLCWRANLPRLPAVALANKTARIVRVVMMRGVNYQAKAVLGQPA